MASWDNVQGRSRGFQRRGQVNYYIVYTTLTCCLCVVFLDLFTTLLQEFSPVIPQNG